MFALTFFGILHVPINVPALGVAVQEDDVHINREMIAHGLSNALSGFAGSIQVCIFLRWNFSPRRMLSCTLVELPCVCQ